MPAQDSDKLIVALDVAGLEEAAELVGKLSSHVGWFKVGSQLFTRQGPRVCGLIKASHAKLFLDLKFHDIPNTVYGAVGSALELGADMITLHTSGGEEMMKAAVRARNDAGREEVELVGVTVLTHWELEEFMDFFSSTRSRRKTVLDLARAAQRSGLDGVVASARELKWLKTNFGQGFKVVTPGIRLEGESGKDDQARVVTPDQAVADGADYLVVGRPIIAAVDPVKACQLFLEKIRRE